MPPAAGAAKEYLPEPNALWSGAKAVAGVVTANPYTAAAVGVGLGAVGLGVYWYLRQSPKSSTSYMTALAYCALRSSATVITNEERKTLEHLADLIDNLSDDIRRMPAVMQGQVRSIKTLEMEYILQKVYSKTSALAQEYHAPLWHVFNSHMKPLNSTPSKLKQQLDTLYASQNRSTEGNQGFNLAMMYIDAKLNIKKYVEDFLACKVTDRVVIESWITAYDECLDATVLEWMYRDIGHVFQNASIYDLDKVAKRVMQSKYQQSILNKLASEQQFILRHLLTGEGINVHRCKTLINNIIDSLYDHVNKYRALQSTPHICAEHINILKYEKQEIALGIFLSRSESICIECDENLFRLAHRGHDASPVLNWWKHAHIDMADIAKALNEISSEMSSVSEIKDKVECITNARFRKVRCRLYQCSNAIKKYSRNAVNPLRHEHTQVMSELRKHEENIQRLVKEVVDKTSGNQVLKQNILAELERRPGGTENERLTKVSKLYKEKTTAIVEIEVRKLPPVTGHEAKPVTGHEAKPVTGHEAKPVTGHEAKPVTGPMSKFPGRPSKRRDDPGCGLDVWGSMTLLARNNEVVPTGAKKGQFRVKTHLFVSEGNIIDYTGDAIVNAANKECLRGDGVDGEITRGGGEPLLLARMELEEKDGIRCPEGTAHITIGGNLTPRIIHAVGPNYEEKTREEQDKVLEKAYTASMVRAFEQGFKSVAFSLISSGIFRGGQSLEHVLQIGVSAIRKAVKDREYKDLKLEKIHMVAFTEKERVPLLKVLEKERAEKEAEIKTKKVVAKKKVVVADDKDAAGKVPCG